MKATLVCSNEIHFLLGWVSSKAKSLGVSVGFEEWLILRYLEPLNDAFDAVQGNLVLPEEKDSVDDRILHNGAVKKCGQHDFFVIRS